MADIFLTLLGIGLIGFAFLFAWSMCMVAKADEDLQEFIERHEKGGSNMEALIGVIFVFGVGWVISGVLEALGIGDRFMRWFMKDKGEL